MNIRYNKQLDNCINDLVMDVTISGYVRSGPEWNGKHVSSPFNRLYLVESGSCWIKTARQQIILEPGKAYLIPPGLQIDYGCDDRISKLYFHINLFKPDHYDLLQGVDHIHSMDIPQGWLDSIIELQNSKALLDALLLKQYLLQFITMFARRVQLQPSRIRTYSRHVSNCISYVQQHLCAKLSVSELARQCYISERQLHKLFRSELGISPGQYLDDHLMLAAQRKLILTSDSIGSISESLGFSDQFYFSRKFKKTFGQTPLQYRKSNQF